MQRFIAIAIAAGCIPLPAAHVVEGAEAGRVELADDSAHEIDTPFAELDTAPVRNIPGAKESPERTDEDKLLGAIEGAHISEPERVVGMLTELRVESTGHLGQLDLEEWSEMMAEMRMRGVALGSRNKLRLLVAARSTAVDVSSVGCRRVQADESSSIPGRLDDSTSATKQAREQESTNEKEGTIFGVSGDGAPRAPQCTAHTNFMYHSFAQGACRAPDC